MTTGAMDDERLHRLLDEELAPEERAAVQAEVARTPGAQEALARLQQTRRIVAQLGVRYAAALDEVGGSDALFDRVRAGIARADDAGGAPATDRRLRVIEGDGAGSATRAPAARRRRVGLALTGLAAAVTFANSVRAARSRTPSESSPSASMSGAIA